MAEVLEIATLGGLEVRLGGRPVGDFASRKAEALLVYLVCRPGFHAREVLATFLWDDRSTSASLGNLSVLLTSLRKSLAPFLRIERDRVALDPDAAWTCDAVELARSLRGALVGDDLKTDSIGRVEAALESYRGPFLEGFYLREARGFEEWAAVEREKLRVLAGDGFRALARYYHRIGQHARGLRYALEWLGLDPLSEAAHREVMLLHARAGDIPLALSAYKHCRTTLQNELGVEPSLETTDLYLRLRSAAETRVDNLPFMPTPFLGRRAELERLGSWLTDPGVRLITIVGPGGIGKTRLAVEAAAARRADFLHGAVFLPLGAVDRAEQLFPALAGAMRFAFQPGGDPRGQLLSRLSEREVLLILDGFEHLLGAVGLLDDILAAAPGAKLLVTSRERLRMVAEWALELDGLDYPAIDESFDADRHDAVALFAQTAARASAGFTLADDDLPWAIRICRRVDGLPLAIEMAGATTSSYTVREIAEVLERTLDFLEGTYRDLPDRQRSLRAVFEHAWQRLPEEGRDLFRRLSVFPASFTTHAAQEVLGASEADLAGLLQASLLHRGQGGRYQAHEVLRLYAVEKASADAETLEAVEQRFRAYYAGLLGTLENPTTGMVNGEAIARLAPDIENLRAAWRSACSAGDEGFVEGALAGYARFLMVRGFFEEGAQACVEARPVASSALLRGRLDIVEGSFRGELGERDQALTLLERGVATLEEVGATAPLAEGFNRMGILARKIGKYDQARRYHEQALNAYQRIGHGRGMADSHNGLGSAHYILGEYDTAEIHYRAALDLFERLQDSQGAGRCVMNLANIADRRGAYELADELYRRSLEMARQAGDRWGVAASLNNQGNIALAREDYLEARRLYAESLALKRELGHPEGVASSLDNLGRAVFGLGELAEARRLRAESLEIRRTIGDPWGIVNSLTGLGEIAVALGDYAEAESDYREALRLGVEIGVPMLVEAALIGWSELLWKRGEVAPSLEILDAVLASPTLDRLTRTRAVGLRDKVALDGSAGGGRRAEPSPAASVEALARRVLGLPPAP